MWAASVRRVIHGKTTRSGNLFPGGRPEQRMGCTSAASAFHVRVAGGPNVSRVMWATWRLQMQGCIGTSFISQRRAGPLFMQQSDHRIDARRETRGNKTGDDRHGRENASYRGNSRKVVGTETV